MKPFGLVVFLAVGSLAGAAAAASGSAKPPHSHAEEITAYEGSRTCAGCHPDTLKDVAQSLHYQQLGGAPFVSNAKAGPQVGMMGSY